MCKTIPIYRIADYCRTHVLAVVEPCARYQQDKQFCPKVYYEYCKAQQRQITSGPASQASGIDPPCALCQLRPRKLFDSLSSTLIYIKAKAGTQTATEREINATGYWEYAIRGQFNWEMTFYTPSQAAGPVREDQAAAGEIMRRRLRQRWSMES